MRELVTWSVHASNVVLLFMMLLPALNSGLMERRLVYTATAILLSNSLSLMILEDSEWYFDFGYTACRIR